MADSEDGVGWVFLEIVVALAIAIAIVWWTFPRKARGADKEADKDGTGKDGR